MARLQILELPQGANDDRPPFLLVVDQAADDVAASLNAPDGSLREGLAEEIGARSILVFRESVEIPANDTTAYLDDSEAVERAEPQPVDERAIQAEEQLKAFMEKRYAIEQERKAAITNALGMDRTRDWDDIRNSAVAARKQRDEQAAAIERVREAPTKPEVMNAQQEHPSVWLHGYKCGVLAARSAAVPRDEKASDS